MKTALAWAGKNGTSIVIFGVLLGFAAPALAEWARPWLGFAVFVFTFGSLLKFDWATFHEDFVQTRRNVAMIMWATFGIPLVVFALVQVMPLDPDLRTGVLFWALVPSSGACVAFAALLGLRTSLALLTTVVATAVTPLYLPWLSATLGGMQLSGNVAAMTTPLLLIVGGAWLASLLVKRYANQLVVDNPDVTTGIAVVALFVAGLGSMHGMLEFLIADPLQMAMMLCLAYALLIAAQISGSVLFWRCGSNVALTAGLICSTRTVTLAWVVLGDDISPVANAFLGCAMVAKYTAPALLKSTYERLQGKRISTDVAAGRPKHS